MIKISIDLTKSNAAKKLEYARNDVLNWYKDLQAALDYFVKRLYNEIITKANYWLDQDSYTAQNGKQNTTDIRNSWDIQVVDSNNRVYKIINTADESIYAEFGTGLTGAYKPHPAAGQAGYNYDVNNHGFLGWDFYNQKAGLYLTYFSGYTGNKFLYKAMVDVKDNVINWHAIWDDAVAKYNL